MLEARPPDQPLALSIVTDTVAPRLDDALTWCAQADIHQVALRHLEDQRFPFFPAAAFRALEAARREGLRVTAVSPGLGRGSVEDEARLRGELGDVLPRSMDGALAAGAPVVIVYGFARLSHEPDGNRVQVLRAFEQVAEAADAAGLVAAVANEPGTWVDRPAESVALLRELGHPALRLHWDPAMLLSGGGRVDAEAFETVQENLAGIYLKDLVLDDPAWPWRPIGRGELPWPPLLRWLDEETHLTCATLEAPYPPLRDHSRESLEALQEMLAERAR